VSHYEYKANPTPTAGYWAGTTANVFSSTLSQILVKATTSTTEFDVIVTNDSSRVIQQITGCTGTINDTTKIPTIRVHTVEIDNATVDEEFEVLLMFDEGH